MTFNPNVTRLNSGVTLDDVHLGLVKKIQQAAILDPSQVWAVLDDEVLPTEVPSGDVFITVRLPSLIWAHGDVFIGGGNNSEFIVQGQSRITLWLRNEADALGQAGAIAAAAVAGLPRGTRLLGRLVRLFWEDDVLNDDGDAILLRPVMFVSYEPPPGTARPDWRPFRLVFELTFNWDLSRET